MLHCFTIVTHNNYIIVSRAQLGPQYQAQSRTNRHMSKFERQPKISCSPPQRHRKPKRKNHDPRHTSFLKPQPSILIFSTPQNHPNPNTRIALLIHRLPQNPTAPIIPTKFKNPPVPLNPISHKSLSYKNTPPPFTSLTKNPKSPILSTAIQISKTFKTKRKCQAVEREARVWAREEPRGTGRFSVTISRESQSQPFVDWLEEEESRGLAV